MGTFRTGPVSLASAQAVADWLVTSRAAFDDLLTTGRAAVFDGMDEFLDISDRFSAQFQDAVDRGARMREDPLTIEISMTAAEQRILSATGTAMQNYLEILAMRGVENVAPSAEAVAGLLVIAEGDFEE